MRKIILPIAISLLAMTPLLAQQDPDDPGMQDSIIVETLMVDHPMRSVTVDIYFVTDDVVTFFNLPLRWQAENDSIYPEELIVQAPWDEVYIRDSISISEHVIYIIGSTGLYPINTDSVRSSVFGIHFQIANFQSQIIPIDTTSDPRFGTLFLGLQDGITEITPAFVSGAIIYDPFMAVDGGEDLPKRPCLLANYPNPFNAQTTISYSLSQAGPVTLSIYNIMGQKVATLVDGIQNAGKHRVVWDAMGLSSGIYYYMIMTESSGQSKKCLLLK